MFSLKTNWFYCVACKNTCSPTRLLHHESGSARTSWRRQDFSRPSIVFSPFNSMHWRRRWHPRANMGLHSCRKAGKGWRPKVSSGRGGGTSRGRIFKKKSSYSLGGLTKRGWDTGVHGKQLFGGSCHAETGEWRMALCVDWCSSGWRAGQAKVHESLKDCRTDKLADGWCSSSKDSFV